MRLDLKSTKRFDQLGYIVIVYAFRFQFTNGIFVYTHISIKWKGESFNYANNSMSTTNINHFVMVISKLVSLRLIDNYNDSFRSIRKNQTINWHWTSCCLQMILSHWIPGTRQVWVFKLLTMQFFHETKIQSDIFV